MAEVSLPTEQAPRGAGLIDRFRRWKLRKISSPAFQRWAARHPLTRGRARREAQKLHHLVSGFVYSQTLLACVELDLFRLLRDGPQTAGALALRFGMAPERMVTLCQAASALGLLTRRADGAYDLGDLGAAALGVPGLDEMIRHHAVFYRDLEDPIALMRGERDPELAKFWSYVRSPDVDPETAARYSRLMASSQDLVAEETLDSFPLTGIRHLADVGGGTGRFLSHIAHLYGDLQLTLMDLPGVIEAARPLLTEAGLEGRIRCHPGSFLDDPLPGDADAISLIRVLYDHDDHTVEALLKRVFDALPSGGRVIISEPMSGGATPSPAGDAYFGFYTMAMTTGRPRSAARHMELLSAAGFPVARQVPTRRPFLTGVVTAQKGSTGS